MRMFKDKFGHVTMDSLTVETTMMGQKIYKWAL